MKRLVKAALIISVLAASSTGAYFYWKGTQKQTQTVSTVEYPVERSSIRLSYANDGTVELPKINLDFDVDGQVEEVYVNVGDTVKKGQVVARLDGSDYQTALDKAKTEYNKSVISLEEAQSQTQLDKISRDKTLEDAQLALSQSKLTYERNQALGNALSKAELDQSKNDYDKARLAYDTQLKTNQLTDTSSKTVALAKQAVESSALALKEAEKNLQSLQLIAPSEGRVLQIGFEPGEYFTAPKDSDSTHFIIIQNAGKVEVASQISEIDLPNVFKDQTAEITFEAYPGKVYNGTVDQVAEYPQTNSNGIVTFDATVSISDADNSIKDGMTCSLEFILSQRSQVLVVPNKSVTFADGKQSVQVKNAQGALETRIIKTGLTDGKQVEVTEGLNEGDVVVYQTQEKV